MAGLLGDGFNDPQSAAIMALAAGMTQGNFGAGLLGSQQAYQGAQDNQIRRQMLAQDLAMKKLAEERAQAQWQMQKDAYYGDGSTGGPSGSLLGGGQPGAPMSPGAFTPPAGGVGPTLPISQFPAQPNAGQANAAQLDRLGRMAIARVPGAKEMLDIFKFKNTPQQVNAGGYSRDSVSGALTYNADPTKSVTMGPDGSVQLLPNALNTQTALTLAAEAPKTLLSSAANVSLRKNADGTERPVSSLSENPTLQGVLDRILGGGTANVPANVPRIGQPPRAAQSATNIAPDEQKARDAESIRMIQSELSNPAIPADQRAGMQRELTRLAAAQSQPGFPTPSIAQVSTQPDAPQPSAGYGKTTAQETADAAAKAGLVKSAEATAADVADTRKTIMNSAFSAPSSIAKYQQLGKLLQDVDGGTLTATGTNIASTMNSLGFKIDKNLPNKEAAASLGNEMALELRSPANGAGMPGALSDKDREFLVGMVPNAGQTTQGRQMLIQSKIAVLQRQQQVATFARNYEKKYGRLDNGFFDQMQAWSNANPLFGGK